MKKQLQGISLILFGILLVLIVAVDPWIPIVEEPGLTVMLWAGFALGVVGLVLGLRGEKK